MALSPAACNRAITSDQHDPSANRPCTSTTLRALTGAAPAAVVRLAEISDAAAPATRAVENVRLFIIMIILFRRRVGMLFGWHGCSRTASGVEGGDIGLSPSFDGVGASIDLGTHDRPAHEGFATVLGDVAVIEVVHHDAEGFPDAARRVVAEPIDPFEPCAIAEVKTRHGVDACRWRGLPTPRRARRE